MINKKWWVRRPHSILVFEDGLQVLLDEDDRVIAERLHGEVQMAHPDGIHLAKLVYRGDFHKDDDLSELCAVWGFGKELVR